MDSTSENKPFGFRPTKARSGPGPVNLKDYLDPLLLQQEGTLSKPLKFLSNKTKYRIAAEIKTRKFDRFDYIDNEMQPTGKDTRHDHASIESRYYKTRQDDETLPTFEDAVEDTIQLIYIVKNFSAHTSLHSKVNASLSSALQHWANTGHLEDYHALRRKAIEGTLNFDSGPQSTQTRRRRILLTAVAQRYHKESPAFSQLCTNSMLVAQMHYVDRCTGALVDSFARAAAGKFTEAATAVRSTAVSAADHGSNFITSCVDNLVLLWNRLNASVSGLIEGLPTISPFSISVIVYLAFFSVAMFFLSYAAIKAFCHVQGHESPVAAMLSASGTIQCPSDLVAQSWFKDATVTQINELGRLSTSLRSIAIVAKTIWEFFLELLDLTYEHFTGYPFTTRAKDKKDAATHFNELIQSCEDYRLDPDGPGRAAGCVRSYKALQSVHKRTFAVSAIATPIITAINKYQHDFDKALAQLACGQDRAEPVVIALTGSPGTGKNIFSALLQQYLSRVHGLPNTAYARERTSEFWSGYRNQTFVVYEEFLASIDPANRFRECDELLKAVSTGPYPLTMADLADKDTTYFTSPYIILTTNSGLDFRNCGLTDQGAPLRRIHYKLVFNQVVNPKSPTPLEQQIRGEIFEMRQVVNLDKIAHAHCPVANGGAATLLKTLRQLMAVKGGHRDVSLDNLDFDEDDLREPAQSPATSETGLVDKLLSKLEVPKDLVVQMHLSDLTKAQRDDYKREKKKPVAKLMPGVNDMDVFLDWEKEQNTLKLPGTNYNYSRETTPNNSPKVFENANPANLKEKILNVTTTEGEARLEDSINAYNDPSAQVPPYNSLTPPFGLTHSSNKAVDPSNLSTHVDVAKVVKEAFHDPNNFNNPDFVEQVFLWNPKMKATTAFVEAYMKLTPGQYINSRMEVVTVPSCDFISGVFVKNMVDYKHDAKNPNHDMLSLNLGSLPQHTTAQNVFNFVSKSAGRGPQDPLHNSVDRIEEKLGHKYFAVPGRDCISSGPVVMLDFTYWAGSIQHKKTAMVPYWTIEAWRRILLVATRKERNLEKWWYGVKNQDPAFNRVTPFGFIACTPVQMHFQIAAQTYGMSACPNPRYYHPEVGSLEPQAMKYVISWSVWAGLAGGVAIVLAALAAIGYSIYNYLFASQKSEIPTADQFEQILVGQSWPEPKGPRQRKVIHPQSWPAPRPNRKHLRGQSFDQSVVNVVSNNLRKLEFFDGDGTMVTFQHCMFIKGGLLLTAAHGVQNAIDRGYRLRVQCGPNNYFQFSIAELNSTGSVYMIPSRDFALLLIRHQGGRDIIKHFTDTVEADITRAKRVVLTGDTTFKYLQEDSKAEFKGDGQVDYQNPHTSSRVKIMDTYLVTLQGFSGQCGYPYFSHTTGKVIGLHCAGNTNVSVVSSVTQIDLKTWIAELTAQTKDADRMLERSPIPDDLQAHCSGPFTSGGVHFIGTLDNTKHFSPTRSDLCPSIFEHIFKPDVRPAYLYKTPDNIYAFDVWCEKNKGKNLRQTYPWVTNSHSWDGVFPKSSIGTPYRLYTFDEVVFGCDTLTALDRAHSPGYPWVLRGLSRAQVLDNYLDELRSQVRDFEDRLSRGESLPTLYVLIPKDEMRPTRKVLTGDTRFVQVAQLSFLILNKMYFSFFQQLHSRHYMETDIMVGINPYGIDWDTMARELTLGKPIVTDGDISKWDICFPPNVAMEFPDQASLRHTGVPVSKLRTILMNTFYTNVLYANMLFEFDGMPSGDFKTAHFNSYVNSVTSRSVFDRFPQPYRLCTLGDDKISGHGEGFDVQKANNILTNIYGWAITDAEKGSAPTAKTLDRCQFLKRGFLQGPRLILAPLALTSIDKMLSWIHVSKEEEILNKSVDNWQVAQRELSLHEEDVYNKYQDLILKELEGDVLDRPLLKRSHRDMREVVALTSLEY